MAGDWYDGSHWHGFLDTNGRVSTFDAPGATNTSITGVNDRGEIAGNIDYTQAFTAVQTCSSAGPDLITHSLGYAVTAAIPDTATLVGPLHTTG
ncbi:MAG: hypothetical protein JOZ58_22720 [Acetobacteraceae bacterium]|nr:hypothetical protein [Acetobacteraceae bacterium]